MAPNATVPPWSVIIKRFACVARLGQKMFEVCRSATFRLEVLNRFRFHIRTPTDLGHMLCIYDQFILKIVKFQLAQCVIKFLE